MVIPPFATKQVSFVGTRLARHVLQAIARETRLARSTARRRLTCTARPRRALGLDGGDWVVGVSEGCVTRGAPWIRVGLIFFAFMLHHFLPSTCSFSFFIACFRSFKLGQAPCGTEKRDMSEMRQ